VLEHVAAEPEHSKYGHRWIVHIEPFGNEFSVD
jgi:hypothetical protein